MAACPQGEEAATTTRQKVRSDPGLADTRFPVDHDAPERTPLGRAKRDGQRAHLGVPADERNRMAVLPPPPRSLWRRPLRPAEAFRTECRTGTEAVLARRHQAGLQLVRTTAEEAMPHQLLDERLIGAFIRDLGALMHASTVLVGDRLGLYRAMADCRWLSPAELADRTDTNTRYVAEWLAAQAASGYVEYDPHTGRFRLSEEQAWC